MTMVVENIFPAGTLTGIGAFHNLEIGQFATGVGNSFSKFKETADAIS